MAEESKFSRILIVKDTLLTLLRFSRLLFKPDDISPIFRGGAFMKAKAFKLSLARIHADPAAAELIRTRYFGPEHDLDALGKLPPGTLGREFADFMARFQLSAAIFPKVLTDGSDDDINYLRLRGRQSHDIHHLVLGIPPSKFGEMMISAFYIAQNQLPLSQLLIGIGLLTSLLKYPERVDDFYSCVARGFTMGKRCKPSVFGIRYEELWEKPLADVRAMMGAEPPEADPAFDMRSLLDVGHEGEPAPFVPLPPAALPAAA